jgi:CheY-like chemotaxis protein
MSRIFVVDDQNDILEVLEQVLIQEGFEVKTSCTSHGIIDTIEEFQPNLILLDTFIGEEDGRQACESIKANASTRDIPIIMLSADRRVEESTKEVGADEFIPKPFSVFTLMNQIERYLKAG